MLINNVSRQFVTPRKTFGFTVLYIFLLLTGCSSQSSSTSDYQGGSSGTTPKFSDPIPEAVAPQVKMRSGVSMGSKVLYGGVEYTVESYYCPSFVAQNPCAEYHYTIKDSAGNVKTEIPESALRSV